MCGRYALALRAGQVRSRLVETNMPTQDAPDDDAFRDTYNFAPGYFGLVYRAEGPDHGTGGKRDDQSKDDGDGPEEGSGDSKEQETREHTEHEQETHKPPEHEHTEHSTGEQHYKLQAMKWGLVPFWTKRQPDYGTTMRTINCRDDSLAQAGGMWASMKRKKRCVVVAQGFYEWQKKNNGRERIPHFVKRKDGQLMCFAGLWDCVRYEDGGGDPLYTYTIVTTDANKQLGFLHDRMPVILDNGSPGMFRWLDKTQTEWTKELQDLLKPYSGELECYPVPREVGKVGNNEARFIAPIDSSANKQNIANFFGKQKQPDTPPKKQPHPPVAAPSQPTGDEANPDEPPATQDAEAASPTPGTKRTRSSDPAAPPEPATNSEPDHDDDAPKQSPRKAAKTEAAPHDTPTKPAAKGRAVRSATKNDVSPSKKAADGSQRITNFFKT